MQHGRGCPIFAVEAKVQSLKLNSISRETLLGNGRVYGGGMHKLKPKELANVPVDELAALVGLGVKHTPRQLELAETVAA